MPARNADAFRADSAVEAVVTEPATEPVHVSPGFALAGLKGLCPRCGAKTLFDGMASFAPRCRACGLDLTQFNVGDGPAAFLTLGVGALMAIGAITLELTVSPPFWVHFLIWLPLTTVAVIGSLRVAKGMLVLAEYRNTAREGRLQDRAP